MNPQFEKILKLPAKQKLGLLFLIIGLLGAGFFFGLYQPKLKEFKTLQTQLEDLSRQASEAQKLANNLPKYKQEYEQLQNELKLALTELPNQKEIPSLLTSIANAGKSAGLEFLLFKPKPEEPKDFYAAVPVDISVSGTFYQIGSFFQAVSALPRIVNISNVNFTEIKTGKGLTTIKVNCLATTFRFLDKKEIKDEKKAK
ncbi:type IV pilus biogenesis protein PilO [Geotalea daltonii FRC-32]|uniref:Type IV pilus biogenesis protein PilO n=1 Tax=Geotalea daltonii (strain DSM 22248 / JCM 15807 / FRC-32) TaxID=316067 RepID=B9M3J0_GEODF|nr:type 4a pilus biogenesis protein PilO [Geotalea daltonii]ACM21411.1 type IV pilus biogenesis protein PilO [Geotalea daltonii FRC-32]